MKVNDWRLSLDGKASIMVYLLSLRGDRPLRHRWTQPVPRSFVSPRSTDTRKRVPKVVITPFYSGSSFRESLETLDRGFRGPVCLSCTTYSVHVTQLSLQRCTLHPTLAGCILETASTQCVCAPNRMSKKTGPSGPILWTLARRLDSRRWNDTAIMVPHLICCLCHRVSPSPEALKCCSRASMCTTDQAVDFPMGNTCISFPQPLLYFHFGATRREFSRVPLMALRAGTASGGARHKMSTSLTGHTNLAWLPLPAFLKVDLAPE
ncbi:hypothetical protein N7468_007079 [Penicillium chermesinum]|uniref:Uncharacterized protein n=1 Tax=Penicillium chermesinum TaxID=63820 RepID=A0A9W9NTI7_9EURO|nr:uncharacterized protein N7468_007079 [Penicillium chermesinum]KAJ5225854.1 hypothetical protein N7468_007079 [Penicillium chermesinum]